MSFYLLPYTGEKPGLILREEHGLLLLEIEVLRILEAKRDDVIQERRR